MNDSINDKIIKSSDKTEPRLEELNPSGLFWRLIAYLVDTTLISIATFIFFTLVLFSVAFGATSFGFDFSKIAELLSNVENKQGIPSAALLLIKLSFLLPGLLSLFYGALFECSPLAATPGKLVMGLKVRGADNGLRVSFSEALSRNFYKNIPTLGTGFIGFSTLSAQGLGTLFVLPIMIALFAYAVIDPLYRFISIERQTLHDKLSATSVVLVPGVNRPLRALLVICIWGGLVFLQSSLDFERQTQTGSDSWTLPPAANVTPTPTPTPTPTATPEIPIVQVPETEVIEELEEEVKELQFEPLDDGPEVLSGQKSLAQAVATPIQEGFRGTIRINRSTFTVEDVVASLNSSRDRIVVNLYDQTLSGSERLRLSQSFSAAEADRKPALRFHFYFSPYGTSCRDGQLKRYVIDVSTKLAGLNSADPFFSFERSGTQIISREQVRIQCMRKEDGHISVRLHGEAAALVRGRRIPIFWDASLIQKFR